MRWVGLTGRGTSSHWVKSHITGSTLIAAAVPPVRCGVMRWPHTHSRVLALGAGAGGFLVGGAAGAVRATPAQESGAQGQPAGGAAHNKEAGRVGSDECRCCAARGASMQLCVVVNHLSSLTRTCRRSHSRRCTRGTAWFAVGRWLCGLQTAEFTAAGGVVLQWGGKMQGHALPPKEAAL